MIARIRGKPPDKRMSKSHILKEVYTMTQNTKQRNRGSTLKRILSLFLSVIILLQIAPVSAFAVSSDILADETKPNFKHEDGYKFTYKSGDSEWANAGF